MSMQFIQFYSQLEFLAFNPFACEEYQDVKGKMRVMPKIWQKRRRQRAAVMVGQAPRLGIQQAAHPSPTPIQDNVLGSATAPNPSAKSC
jgi:hypothetical protein